MTLQYPSVRVRNSYSGFFAVFFSSYRLPPPDMGVGSNKFLWAHHPFQTLAWVSSSSKGRGEGKNRINYSMILGCDPRDHRLSAFTQSTVARCSVWNFEGVFFPWANWQDTVSRVWEPVVLLNRKSFTETIQSARNQLSPVWYCTASPNLVLSFFPPFLPYIAGPSIPTTGTFPRKCHD